MLAVGDIDNIVLTILPIPSNIFPSSVASVKRNILGDRKRQLLLHIVKLTSQILKLAGIHEKDRIHLLQSRMFK